MARSRQPIWSLNGGEIAPSALDRIDADKLRLAASTFINWLPKSLGPMTLRPGLGYLGSSLSNAAAVFLPFIASTDDTALIEITAAGARVWIEDELVIIPVVSTTITSGDFSASTGWTLTSTNGGTATISGGVLTLGTLVRGSIATATNEVTVAGADQNVEHRLHIQVTTGPVDFRVGTTAGAQDYIAEQKLGTGEHSLAFTPTGNFFVFFGARSFRNIIVTSCEIETDTTLQLTTPWVAAGDLDKIRYSQSGDVVYIACQGYQPRQFERRLDGRSWSLVNYESLKGPFQSTGPKRIKLQPNVREGNGVLRASSDFFTSDHVGALFRVWHDKQSSVTSIAGENEWSPGTVVRGEGSPERDLTFTLSGTWAGLMSFQNSDDGEDWLKDQINDGGWSTHYDTGNNIGPLDLTISGDNLTRYLRSGFLPGDYTSGTAVVTISYKGASGFAGIARVTSITSATEAAIEVTRRIYDTGPSSDWEEGLWSNATSHPSAVELYEGRLWLPGGARVSGSASDDYTNFDADLEFDNAPIVRVLGEGPVDNVHWALGLDGGLLLGTSGGVISVRSSNFGLPLTPADMMAKKITGQGAAAIQAIDLDGSAVYVHRSRARLYELAPTDTVSGFAPNDLTATHDEILDAGVVAFAIQRQPDTRLHLVLADGTAAILTFDRNADLLSWSRVETDGSIERVVVLPGEAEDRVYYHVNRTIGGATKRYLEKWALESEARPGKVAKLADSFLAWTDTGTTISGFDHLAGEQVVVWGDSGPVMDTGDPTEPKLHTVSGGGVLTLASVINDGMGGLPYTADWTSTKLGWTAAAVGGAQGGRKRITQFALTLQRTHSSAIEVGGDTGSLKPLPRVIKGKPVPAIFDELDMDVTPAGGDWDTDPRLHIRAKAPLPATIRSASIEVDAK